MTLGVPLLVGIYVAVNATRASMRATAALHLTIIGIAQALHVPPCLPFAPPRHCLDPTESLPKPCLGPA